MTLKQAAQSALDVQNACNFSGVVKSLAGEIIDALWVEARLQNQGSQWVARHPITTMYMLKLAEMNGFDSTLNPAYELAEMQCMAIAQVDYQSL